MISRFICDFEQPVCLIFFKKKLARLSPLPLEEVPSDKCPDFVVQKKFKKVKKKLVRALEI
jgi:hypothetical protein